MHTCFKFVSKKKILRLRFFVDSELVCNDEKNLVGKKVLSGKV